jgi:hypothetical protein
VVPTVFVVLATTLSSCSGTSANESPKSPSFWTASTFYGDSLTVSFKHPAAWQSQLEPLSLHYAATFGFLANFTLHQFCGSVVRGGGCIWADLGPFPPNGLLLSFGTNGYGPGLLTQKELLGPGTVVSIGGHLAHRRVNAEPAGGDCLGTGAQESLSYTVLDGKRQGAFYIDFCYRGPHLRALRSVANQVAGTFRIAPGPVGVGPQPS